MPCTQKKRPKTIAATNPHINAFSRKYRGSDGDGRRVAPSRRATSAAGGSVARACEGHTIQAAGSEGGLTDDKENGVGRIACGTAVKGGYSLSPENVKLVADAGVELVEIHFAEGDFPYHDRDALKAAARVLREAGVACRSVHLDFKPDYDISSPDEVIRRRTVEDMRYGLSVAGLLGARIAVVHGSDEPIADDERARRFELMRESLTVLSGAAAEAGMQLALELLPRTCLANTTAEAVRAVEGLPRETVGFCFDVNHVNLREDPAEAVRALGERIFTFHISDNDGVDERHWFPFEGVIDWKSFMEAVREIGYEGAFIFETGGSLDGDVGAFLKELHARFERLMAL